MTAHRFRAGQRVQLAANAPRSSQPYVSRYTITGLLPSDAYGPVYRVKGDGETHERTMAEAALTAMF